MRSKLFALMLVLGSVPASIARADETAAVDATSAGCLSAEQQGEANRKDGKLASALERFDTCAATQSPEPTRTSCSRRREELDAAIPTVAFAVRDALGRDLDATVTLDGSANPIPLGRSMRLDPGIHQVQWKSAAGEGRQSLTVFENQRNRIVSLVADPVRESKEPSPVRAHETRAHDLWPWVVVGAGGLLVATAAVFELVALNEDSQRKALDLALTRSDLSTVERTSYRESRQSHHDAAEADEAIAITLGITGLVAIGAGVTWALVRDRGTSSAALRVLPKRGGATFGISF